MLQIKVENGNQSEVKLFFQSIGVTHVLNTAEQHVDVRLSMKKRNGIALLILFMKMWYLKQLILYEYVE